MCTEQSQKKKTIFTTTFKVQSGRIELRKELHVHVKKTLDSNSECSCIKLGTQKPQKTITKIKIVSRLTRSEVGAAPFQKRRLQRRAQSEARAPWPAVAKRWPPAARGRGKAARGGHEPQYGLGSGAAVGPKTSFWNSFQSSVTPHFVKKKTNGAEKSNILWNSPRALEWGRRVSFLYRLECTHRYRADAGKACDSSLAPLVSPGIAQRTGAPGPVSGGVHASGRTGSCTRRVPPNPPHPPPD